MIRTALLVILTAILLSGCNRLATINNIDANPVVRYDGKQLTIDEVERAILIGGHNRGWKMQSVHEGVIHGTLNVRSKHQAIVEISYNTSSYSITYHDSLNLRYSPPNQIHRNYNNWIEYLVQSIDQSIDKIDID